MALLLNIPELQFLLQRHNLNIVCNLKNRAFSNVIEQLCCLLFIELFVTFHITNNLIKFNARMITHVALHFASHKSEILCKCNQQYMDWKRMLLYMSNNKYVNMFLVW